jgi:hypothetical protein
MSNTIKPTKLVIKNIGKIADSTIAIDKPLILFYGEIRQGKSTILNCVRWVCGGEFPDDIIHHGAKEGSIELHFEGGMIGRSFYKSKDGETKARAVVFVRDGRPVSSPVSEIKRMLNPFLLDQDFLRNKTELERKRYFVELFEVDTTALDRELFDSERAASELRSKITGYGDIDLTKVEPVDASAMRVELDTIRKAQAAAMEGWEKTCRDIDTKHGAALAAYTTANADVQRHNATVDRNNESLAETLKQIARLSAELQAAKDGADETQQWIAANPRRQSATIPTRPANPQKPEAPDTAALEAKIQDAGATNAKAEQYAKNKKRADEKAADEKALLAREKRQREIKAEREAKLKEISNTCGIDGLEFDAHGDFIYQGTTAGMISDSQIMRLSSELSALYPDGFGLDLIDRGESLGRSIFEFVDRAKAEKKTIMATIVGERPAKVPPEIGVFVVDNGHVKGDA